MTKAKKSLQSNNPGLKARVMKISLDGFSHDSTKKYYCDASSLFMEDSVSVLGY